MIAPARAAAACEAKRIVIVTAAQSGKNYSRRSIAAHRQKAKHCAGIAPKA